MTEHAPTIRGLKQAKGHSASRRRGKGSDGTRPDNQGIETPDNRVRPAIWGRNRDGTRPDNQGIETPDDAEVIAREPERPERDGTRPDNQGIETDGDDPAEILAAVDGDGTRPDNQGIETIISHATSRGQRIRVTEHAPTIRGLKRRRP